MMLLAMKIAPNAPSNHQKRTIKSPRAHHQNTPDASSEQPCRTIRGHFAHHQNILNAVHKVTLAHHQNILRCVVRWENTLIVYA